MIMRRSRAFAITVAALAGSLVAGGLSRAADDRTSAAKTPLGIVMSDGSFRPLTLISDKGTLTANVTVDDCGTNGQYTQTWYGYDEFGGSYSPVLTGGERVTNLYIITGHQGGACSILGTYLHIAGFSSNPGSSWLSSVQCGGGTTLDSSTATTYAYGPSGAEWRWTAQYLTIVGGTNTCTIIHN